MADTLCTLQLARRMWSVVDGARYEGEIMRFELVAVPAPGAGATGHTLRVPLMLRISRGLLDCPSWRGLTAAQVARHARAYLEETLQRQGLPEHTPATYVLNESTDGGSYLQGSPFTVTQNWPTRPFVVHDTRGELASSQG